MYSSRLPLRVRLGLREYWEDANTPVQVARSAVKQLLGIDVVFIVEWELLIVELDEHYPDKSTLVPSISVGVQAFLNGLREILDSEVDPEWTDTLLERCNGSLKLLIGISEEAEVFWSSKEAGLNVKLPKGKMPSLFELQPVFKAKCLQCFDDQQSTLDDWADLSKEDANHNSTSTGPHQHATDTFPDISLLQRPDQLLLKPPYHLAVYNTGRANVEIQCSHSPTLELLADYLKKWCKTNPHQASRPPAVEVKLHQSPFGLGPIYDRLTLSVEERNSYFLVSPMLVLSFIEGVLGYKSVSVDGGSWIFRKDIEFRK
ncbi:uncharacterized protein GGS22DRAFT_192769 [Annulohypoxylon maeteangense]|uniref:uncharacterized protein n=1 Tax=Annulohypoxylon maeteangense TaxID=1927788 RepID=UPI002008B9F2|nr:uncharacterized protein GGS22DRAFT_192769 [Annulohypoxylon maeteangense]KAI0880932.1 hypothetical protein GGS22DRAFT_192769 [Annulohypoxylon maeteangense]